MSKQPKTTAPSAEWTTIASHPLAGQASDLPLLRFRLRHLFWFVAAFSVLLAGMVAFDGRGALVLLLGALIVAGHLTSTSIGTRLRAHTDDMAARQREHHGNGRSQAMASDRRAQIAAVRHVPRSPWHGRGSTALPWLRRLVAAGALSGGVAGAVLLKATIGHRTSPAGVALGAVSIAVLGGWFTFVAGNFYGVLRHGLRDATEEQPAPISNHRSK